MSVNGLREYLFDPSGNKTMLVDNRLSAISSNQYAYISQGYMQVDLALEQVGFIEPSARALFRLEMMGGELCVNALSCAGYLAYHETGVDEHAIESAGNVYKTRVLDGHIVRLYFADVLEPVLLEDGLFLVKMDGIVHFVLQGDLSRQDMSHVLRRIRRQYKEIVDRFPAVALLVVNGAFLTPLVWVRDTDTEVFERACGSGTIAACFALDRASYMQPSGAMISVVPKVDGFYLESSVELLSC